MFYTVNKLAKISGVSVRTLHFYDEIGLLKPAFYGENNYRYYKEEQLLKLQQILFYRELGFPLNEIQRIIESGDFNKVEALQSHKKILEQNLNRTNQLIKTIDKTISHLRGKIGMRDEELFMGFDPIKQKKYEEELINSGRVTQAEIDSSRDKVKHCTSSDWQKFKNEFGSLHTELVEVMEQNFDPDSVEAQKLIRKHYEMILNFWTPTKETYIGLSQLYCSHPDFVKFYNDIHPKLLNYLMEAMKIYAENELS